MPRIMLERSGTVKNYFPDLHKHKRPLPPHPSPLYTSTTAVTACTAAIARDVGDPVILMVADTRLSWDYDSIDTALKIRRVHTDWLFGFATNSTASSATLFQDIQKALKGKRDFMSIRDSSQEVYQRYGTDWHFLLAGFDQQRSPHIFKIVDGTTVDRDLEAFGSVGSGSFLADAYLASYPYKQSLPLAESIYCVLAAKFESERAGGVGRNTDFSLLRPAQSIIGAPDAIPIIDPSLVQSVRDKWEAMPRIPEGTKDEIEQYLNAKGRFKLSFRKIRKRVK